MVKITPIKKSWGQLTAKANNNVSSLPGCLYIIDII